MEIWGYSTTHSWHQHYVAVAASLTSRPLKLPGKETQIEVAWTEPAGRILRGGRFPQFPGIQSRLHYHLSSNLVTILTELQQLHFWLNSQVRRWKCGVLTTDKFWSKRRSGLLIYQMFLRFYGKRILIFVFTTFRYRSLSWARLIQFSTTQLRALRFILLLTIHPTSRFSMCRIRSGVGTKIFNIPWCW